MWEIKTKNFSDRCYGVTDKGLKILGSSIGKNLEKLEDLSLDFS